jgi:hypothetical protein
MDTASTYRGAYNWTGDVKDYCLDWAQEVEDLVDGTTAWSYFPFSPTATAAATEGYIYYDSDDDTLKYRNASAWVSLTSGTGDNTLDDAYRQGGAGSGGKIDADGGVVEIEVPAQANTGALLLDNDDTNDLDVLQITNAGSGSTAVSIDVDGQATGRDWEGTGATSIITGAGAATFSSITDGGTLSVGGNITLQNSEVIGNATDTEISFASDTENFSIDFVNNEIDFKSSSDVVTVGWGDLDAHTGLNSITFDAASSALTLPTDGAGDDLLIQTTGATDSSITIQSTGTEADAIVLNATAGGIDLTATGAAGQDIDLVNTGGSVNIEGTEGIEDAVTIVASTAAGGIDITSEADIDITTTGQGGEDISITNTGGSINIRANENNTETIVIDTAGGGGASEGITLHVDQGTATDSIDIQTDAGGIDIDAADDITMVVSTTGAAEDIILNISGAQDSSIVLDSDGTGADAISLQADGAGGGIDVDTDDGAISIVADGAANGDITIDAQDKIVIVSTDADGTDSIYIHANGGASEDIRIHSDQGTGAASIELLSDVGGIDITAEGTAAGDILIDANDDLFLLATSLADNGLTIEVDGGTAEGIYIHSDQGTSADSIELLSDVGGIDITAEDTAAGDILIDANDDLMLLSTSLADNGLTIEVDGGASEGIYIHSDQGTSADSIELLSDVGGITVTATGAAGAGVFTLQSLLALGAAGTLADNATPDVSGGSYWETGAATTYTDFDVDTGTVVEGTIIIIKSLHAAVFDVTGTELEGGTADLTTASGDLTAWIYDGTAKWRLFFFMDMSDDLS